MAFRRGAALLALMALVGVGCVEFSPEDVRTREDFCFLFDRMLDALEDDEATPEEVDRAIQDFITGGVSFGIRGNAPRIRQEVESFAAALDGGDQATVDEFINSTLRYCEDVLESV